MTNILRETPEQIKNHDYGEWRRRQPELILITKPTIMGELRDEGEEFSPIVGQIFDQLEYGHRCFYSYAPTYSRQSITTDGTRRISHEESEYASIINPVLMGRFPAEIMEASKISDEDFRRACIEFIPENDEHPLAFSIGSRQLGLKGAHKNFVNLIMFETDSDSDLLGLSVSQRVILSRILFAKTGSWKAFVAGCSRDESGELKLDGVMMSTLEGGCPVFRTEDLAEAGWRQKVFGASGAVEVQKMETSEEMAIPSSIWENSPAVNGIINTGKLFGKEGYLSPSIIYAQQVKGKKYAEFLQRVTGQSQQGEGAFFAWSPNLNKLVVSCTGQMGAVKADLKHDEVVAIVPVLDKNGDPAVGKIAVEGYGTPKAPSVEGPEFGFPLWEIYDQTNVYVREVDGKYELCSIEEDGATKIPPIRAGGHLHRGEVLSDDPRVGSILIDHVQWPPVGCGADSSNEFSEWVFREAVRKWEDSGRILEIITYEVPGHGTNYLQFYAIDKLNAMDHSEPLAKHLKNGSLKFTQDVPQIEEIINPVFNRAA